MTNNCIPSQATPAVDDPCALLPQLRAALYALMTGQQRQQVRHGDQWLTWHQGNVKELRAEVRRLEAICDPRYAPQSGRVVGYRATRHRTFHY
jgi:hypothetical protein